MTRPSTADRAVIDALRWGHLTPAQAVAKLGGLARATALGIRPTNPNRSNNP